ncbi:MAG: hypothetical protein AB7G11_06685 [Phycisphaerales bacterium]
MQTQLVAAPDSDSRTDITPLGYLDAYDAVLNDDYAFAAYKETDRDTGAWRVRIKARHLTGVVLEPDAMRLQARSAGAQGKEYFTWGNCIDPSAGDARSVQYRVHVKDAKPAMIEVFVQLRRADGSPDAPRSMTVAWPA